MFNMVDAVGLNGEQTNAVTQDMVHSISGGTIQNGDLNVIGQYFPMFREALEKYESAIHHGKKVTGADLRDMAKQGKISSEDYEKVFEKLGNGKYAGAAERMLSTFNGMERTIKARIPALMGEIEKPFMSQTSGLYGGISKWVSAKKTEKEFQNLGSALNKSVTQIAGAFGKAFNIKSAPQALDKIVQGLTKDVTKFGNYIAKHPEMIKKFFDTTKDISVATIKVYAQALKDMLPVLKIVGNFAEKHPKVFADMFGGLVVANTSAKIFKSTLGGLINTVGLLTSAFSGFKKVASFAGIGGKIGKHGAGGGGVIGSKVLSKGATKSGGKIAGELAEDAPEVGSRVARYAGKAGRFRGLIGGAKAVGSKIPYLDIAMAGTTLLGTNKHNVGKHVGNFAGTLGGMEAGAAGGAALGSVIPGVGTAIGGVVGGGIGAIGGSALGKKIGGSIQKAWPTISKSTHSLIQKTSKVLGGMGSSISKTMKPLGKKIGNGLHSAFYFAGKVGKGYSKLISAPFVFGVGLGVKAYKKLRKPTSEALSWVGKQWKSFSKTAGRDWRAIAKPVSQEMSKAGKSVHKNWNSLKKWLGSFFGGIGSWIGKKWSEALSHLHKPMTSFSQSVHSVFNGVGKYLSSWGDGIKHFFSNIGHFISNTISSIGNSISHTKLGKFVSSTYNTGKKALKGHATGGLINQNGVSLVGEDGDEILQRGKKFSFIGTKGAELMALRVGDRIYSHQDALRMSRGDYAKRLPNFATGTTKPKKRSTATTVKPASIKVASNTGVLAGQEFNTRQSMNDISRTITLGYSQSNRNSQKQLKSLDSKTKSTFTSLNRQSKKQTQQFQKNTVGDFKDTQKGAQTQLKQINRQSKSSFNSLTKETKRQTQKIQSNTVGDFDDAQKGVNVQMKQMRSGVRSYGKDIDSAFNNVTGKLPGYAKNGMKGAISNINKGLSGVNTVLGQFGGSKSVLNMAHYANGSHGAITQNHVGIVNDEKSPHYHEMILRGNKAMIPQGHDVAFPLRKGDKILNGRDTERYLSSAMPHYKKGTTSLKKLINKNNKDPKGAWNNEFGSQMSNSVGTAIGKALNGTSHKGANSVGDPWSTSVWSAFENAMSSSGAGGNWRHTPGLKETNGFNASRGNGVHDGVDFSGPVGSAFRAVHGGTVARTGGHNPWNDFKDLGNIIEVRSDDGFEEIYQEFGPTSSIGVHTGDTVKTGQVLGHLGRLNGHDVHVHVGVSKGSLWNHGGYSHKGWYDVTKMHGSSNGSAKTKSHNSPLDKYVKKQLAPQIKWISKNLSDDDAGGSMGNPGGASVGRWKPYVIKALKANGFSASPSQVSAWMRVIQRESNGNPKAVNHTDINAQEGHPSKGLVQTIESTFNGNKFKGHDNIFNGYDDLLAGIRYMSRKYGRGASAFARVSGTEGYANGGWSKNDKLNVFGEVAGEPEVAINPKRASADQLISQAISARAKIAPNSLSGQLKKYMELKNSAKSRKSIMSTLMSSLRQTAKAGTKKQVQPQIVISPTINFNAPVDKATADYASKTTANEIKKVVQQEVAKMYKNAFSEMDMDD